MYIQNNSLEKAIKVKNSAHKQEKNIHRNRR